MLLPLTAYRKSLQERAEFRWGLVSLQAEMKKDWVYKKGQENQNASKQDSKVFKQKKKVH